MPKLIRVVPIMVMVCAIVLYSGDTARGQTGNSGTLTRTPAPEVQAKGASFNYQNVSVGAAVDLLEQLSGKHLIRDANLNGVPPVSFNADGLGKDDAVKLIIATLLLNGVAILPVDEHTMKVVTTGTNKNPRSEGTRVYTNAADLPADDEIVTYYMPLANIDPREAAGIFTEVAPVHVYGAYVPAPSARAIILTENVSVIRELIALKDGIDQDKVPHPKPPGPPPPGAPGAWPPHRHHPLFGLLVLVAIVAGSFFIGRWVGRRRSA